MSRATDQLRATERHAAESSCLHGWTDAGVLPDWVWLHVSWEQAEGLRPVTLWRWLLRSSGLDGTTRAVGLWLSEWIRESEDKRIAAPCEVEDIAKMSGFGERTVRRALAKLEAAAWIASVYTKTHKAIHWPTFYVLHLPAGIECPCRCNVTPVDNPRRPVTLTGRDAVDKRPVAPESDPLDRSESPADRSLSQLDRSESPSPPVTVTGPIPALDPALDPAETPASPDGDTHRGGDASLSKAQVKPETQDPSSEVNGDGPAERRARAEKLATMLRADGRLTDAEIAELVAQSFPDLRRADDDLADVVATMRAVGFTDDRGIATELHRRQENP